MAKQYRLTTNTRFGNAGEVVSEQHLADNDADMADLRNRKLIEDAGRTEDADDGRVGDEANKERIEQAIRDESTRLGRPLEEHEKNKVAADVTRDSAAQTKDAVKDATKEQQQANAAASKGDATKAPKTR